MSKSSVNLAFPSTNTSGIFSMQSLYYDLGMQWWLRQDTIFVYTLISSLEHLSSWRFPRQMSPCLFHVRAYDYFVILGKSLGHFGPQFPRTLNDLSSQTLKIAWVAWHGILRLLCPVISRALPERQVYLMITKLIWGASHRNLSSCRSWLSEKIAHKEEFICDCPKRKDKAIL